MSLNKVMLIGNTGKDPEIRYLDNNVKVATFTLATTEKYRDREGVLKELTEWHNIITWRFNAEIVEKYVKKGTQLFIEGRLRTRSWEDRNGNARYTTEIMADNIQLLGKRPDSQERPSAPSNRPAEQTGPTPPPVSGDDTDDLPF